MVLLWVAISCPGEPRQCLAMIQCPALRFPKETSAGWSALVRMVTDGTAAALALRLLGDKAVLSQNVFLVGKSLELFPRLC